MGNKKGRNKACFYDALFIFRNSLKEIFLINVMLKTIFLKPNYLSNPIFFSLLLNLNLR